MIIVNLMVLGFILFIVNEYENMLTLLVVFLPDTWSNDTCRLLITYALSKVGDIRGFIIFVGALLTIWLSIYYSKFVVIIPQASRAINMLLRRSKSVEMSHTAMASKLEYVFLCWSFLKMDKMNLISSLIFIGEII